VESGTPRISSPLAAALLAVVAASCAGTPRLRVAPAEATLSPMLAGVCSVFVMIANAGDGDDALVEARADVPGSITQLHVVRDGRMVQRDRLVVPAGGALELRPGGPHVMVFNLPKEGVAGDRFTLHLRFERSGEMQTAVTLTDASADEE
jgi:copper(I)-binding protein